MSEDDKIQLLAAQLACDKALSARPVYEEAAKINEHSQFSDVLGATNVHLENNARRLEFFNNVEKQCLNALPKEELDKIREGIQTEVKNIKEMKSLQEELINNELDKTAPLNVPGRSAGKLSLS